MSGDEHLDVGSAHLKGINESVESYGERDLGYGDSGFSEKNEDGGGSIMQWDIGKGFGDDLHELGMLENKVQACGSDGMGRISNSGFSQHPVYGLNPANVGSEKPSDIGSAHLKGINESVADSRENKSFCSEINQSVPSVCIESYEERDLGYTDCGFSEKNEDGGGSIMQWDIGKGFGDGLHELGMLENKVQACESDGMGRISNSGFSQHPVYGLNPANVGSEKPSDIGSAHLKGINESVADSRENKSFCSEINQSVPSVCIESYEERDLGYTDCGFSEKNEDGGGSIMQWDIGKGFGDGLHELGMLENKVQACGSDGMGRISNSGFSQRPVYGLNSANVGSEEPSARGGYIMTSEPAENVTRTSIFGNEETLIEILSPVGTVGGVQGSTGDNEGCFEPAKLSNGKNNRICDAVEDGNQVCSMSHIPCHEMPICERSRLENPVGVDSLKSELSSEVIVDKTNSLVPDLVGQSLITVDNAQPGLCGQRLSSYPTTENQQDGFGQLNTFTLQAEEKNGTQFQNCSTPGGNIMEGLSENNCESGHADDLLNKSQGTSNVTLECSSPERAENNSNLEETLEALKECIHGTHNSKQSEHKTKNSPEAAPENSEVEQTTDSDIGAIESSPNNTKQVIPVILDSSYGIEKTIPVGSDVEVLEDYPEESKKLLSEELTRKLHVVVFGCPAAGTSEFSNPGRRKKLGIHVTPDSSYGIEKTEPDGSDVECYPEEQNKSLSEELTRKLHVVVFGCPAAGTSEFSNPGRRKKLGIHVTPDSSYGIEKTEPDGSDVECCSEEQNKSLSEELTRKPHVVVFGCPVADTSEFSNVGRRKSYGIPLEKKYPERSLVNSTRALRPRSQGNPKVPETSSNIESGKSSTGKRRGRKKKTEIEGKSYDEFLRMRKHLKYLLHRIRSEQNLLDAYCSEGWRGQSLEKLRPEKELERAKADINRSKLKIRDLFRHLDSLSAEGRFPDSLFDSEGLIDSEDIFCAKCGTDGLSADNDIILCDGACERGFHQFCLEPPLRTEEIPPGDEGWLCPACDCKIDCVDLLNDSQLTKLSIEYNWEKVFPEAIASSTLNEQDDMMGLPSDDSGDNDYDPDGPGADDAKVEGSGSRSDASDSSESDSSDSDFSSASEDLGALGGQEPNLGLPSDDSEDDDYDPDGPDDNDAKVEGSGSRSDKSDLRESDSSDSDFSSASEDLGALGVQEQNLGLPSDDSEDDDYDPNSARVNEDVEKQSSSSDFTSASEDLGAAIHNDGTSGDDELELPVPLLEPDQDTAEFPPLSGRRHVERLDYKKLYDETYANGPSDSSDDEEWTDVVSASKRKDNSKKGVSDSSKGKSLAFAHRRRGRKKLNPQAVNGSPDQPVKSSEKLPSGDNSTKRPHNRLGEAVTRRLYESFKENQYHDRLMKENLANELGLTTQQETYANVPSDSSDDEEWTDVVSASKKKDNSKMGVSDSSKGKSLAFAPRRRGRKKLNPQAVNGSPDQPVKSSEKLPSGDKSTKKPHNRLGEAATRRLYESFKENQYPDRLMKENLANELGLTTQQVHKWFESVRWTSKHNPGRLETSMSSHKVAFNVVENRSADSSKFDANEGSKIKPTPKRTSRKRQNTEDHQPIMPNTETSNGGAQIDSLPASKRKDNSKKGVSDSSKGKSLAFAPRRRGRKKLNPQAVNGSPDQPVKSSEKLPSGDNSTKRPHNRLGEAVTRRLYESFKENQYPDRLMKENLANELGLTTQQVHKWFESVRWISKHNPGRLETSMSSHKVAFKVVENRSADSSKFDANEGSKLKPTPKRTNRKRKNTEDHQPIMPNTETSNGGTQIDSLPAPKAQHRITRKKRKSSA